MRIEENYSLEKHNTFHLPVKARWFMEYTNDWGGSSGTNIFRNVCRCISEVAVICCL